MKREQVTDMTKGPVFRQMAAFALPVLLGMIFQRIYNFADAYIVGRYLGDGALAAVSIAGTAMYMMTSIMQAFVRSERPINRVSSILYERS